MRRVIVKCGCGHVIKTIEIEDGSDKFVKGEYEGMCDFCLKNGGDYTKSPHWKDKKRGDT